MQTSQSNIAFGNQMPQPVGSNKSACCAYTRRTCSFDKLKGYEFCMGHILQDPTAPYKQCSYISNKTNRRCTNATLKTDRKDGYCNEHAQRSALLRQKSTRKRKPRETPQQLFEELAGSYENRGSALLPDMKKSRSTENSASIIFEYASSSESELEAQSVEAAWAGDSESEAESLDSEQEEPLKYAGVYTAEEVAMITRDKMIRLQSLYIDQFKRLQHMLKENRRQYLYSVGQHRELYGNISNCQEDPEQRETFEKLQAMKRYHRRFGTEALLHRQNKDRRIQVSEGANYKPPAYAKCIHTSGGVKCSERTVPLAKYCIQHILNDRHQVLFQRCGFNSGICDRPVPVLNGDDSACPFHAVLGSSIVQQILQQSDKEHKIKVETECVTTTADGAAMDIDVTSVTETSPEGAVKTEESSQLPVSTTDAGGVPTLVADLADEKTMSETGGDEAKPTG